MKIKFLSLVLIVLMLPFSVVLSACGSGNGYNLNNLSSDFYSIVNNESDNIIKNDKKIMFHYSHHVHNNKTFLNDAINKAPYSNIKIYNEIFDNMMTFSFNYIETCSNNDVEVSEDVKNDIQVSMNELHSAIEDVNACTDLFAELIKITPEDKITTDNNCLQRFKYLVVSYETLLIKTSNFTTKLEKIYFNNVLTDSNPRISNVKLEDFNVYVIANIFDARLKSQVSNLTKVYVELNVCGLADSLNEASEISALNLKSDNYENYKNNISQVNKTISAQSVANAASSNKTSFYNWAVKAYNAQVVINDEILSFLNACNKINYIDVRNNILTATAEQKIEKLTIDTFNTIILEYNKILVEMIKIVNT